MSKIRLSHEKARTEYYYVPFSMEEVKSSFITNNPKEIWLNEYSTNHPAGYIRNINDKGLDFKWHASANEDFETLDWDEFYKKIKQYLNSIIINSFECYEFYRANMPANGCVIQCDKCKQKQSQIK